MTDAELKKLILKYLGKNRLMTIATSFEDSPWAATLFFANDSDLNLYFLSEVNTRKIQNILKNPRVSVTLDREQPDPGIVKGIQLEGETVESSDPSIFLARHPWAKNYLKTSKVFKIKPSKIIYLDDEKFGPGGKRELNLK